MTFGVFLKMKNIIKLLNLMILFAFFSFNVNGLGNEDEYLAIACQNQNGYELNQEKCDTYYSLKSINDANSIKIDNYNDDFTTVSIEQLVKNINEINYLINKYQVLIEENNNEITINKKKIMQLENSTLESLVSMQTIYNDNSIIDFIMGSSNIEELLVKIDGIKNITDYNNQILDELYIESINNENKKIELNNQLLYLKEIKEKQNKMLIEFRRKEANIYSNVQSGGTGTTYNNKIDTIDFSKINDDSEWQKPFNHALISAGTWGYQDGGFHPGIDFAIPVGTPILAPADGILIGSGTQMNGYGNHIIVAVRKDDYIYTIIYAHLNNFKNDVATFRKGDIIGYSGNTGFSTGPHTHVEVIRHNTNNLKAVVDQYKKMNDTWFGLGYNGKGSSSKVQRLRPESVFGVKVNQTY